MFNFDYLHLEALEIESENMIKPIEPDLNMEDGDGVSGSAEAITKAVMYLADIVDHYIDKYFEERKWN